MNNKKQKEQKVFSFKISLNDSNPKVWRRILVPSDYTFFDLHVAIQNAMGWFDSHLHAFYISSKNSTRRTSIQFPNPEDDDFYFREALDERKEKIVDYFGKTIKQCQYVYDFGDNWDHTVFFEGEKDLKANIKYPVCTAGKNMCPFEDSCGVWGFQRLVKILKDPTREEYEEMAEWIEMFGFDDPQDIDPTHFDIEEIEFENPKKRLKEYEKGFGIV